MLSVVVLWVSETVDIAQPANGVRWIKVSLTSLVDAQGKEHMDAPAEVALPHSWRQDGLPQTGVGRYAMTAQVGEAVVADMASEPWSMRIDHLSAAHRIWVNGVLLRSSLPRPGWFAVAGPQLIDLDGAALRPGLNRIDIEVHAIQQGGLSTAVIDRKQALNRDFVVHRIIARDLMVTMNVVWITFSILVLALWWLRREETAAGLFGVLVMVASARNFRMFVEEDMGWSLALDTWFYFTAHVLTSWAQGMFVMALVGRSTAWFKRGLEVILVVYPLAAAALLHWDPTLNTTRAVLQASLIFTLLPSAWMMLKWAWQRSWQTPEQLGLALGWVSFLVAALHDFYWGRWLGLVTVQHWAGWIVPLSTPFFMMIVVQRVVRAFNDIEQSNQQLESKVAERTRELAAANAAKGQFLAAASHDLRQPVAAIGLITDLLQSRLTDPQQRALTDRLTRAVSSMEALLKGLLDLSRLDSGTVEVQRRRVRLQVLLDAVASHESESARHKGLRLTVRPTPAVVWTDPVLLEQILRNLVGNAIRHTASGGVLVGVRRRGTQWVVQVHDSGPGIAPKDLPRIFEAFVQLSNPGRDRNQGLGLGLAIVQRGAELLAHPLTVRSKVGFGSCFCVSVPAATLAAKPPAPVAPAPAAPASVQAAGAQLTWTGLRFMVVEDDAALRDTLTSLLEGWGAQVLSGGSVAWALAQSGPWDFVVSDHRLSDGSGRDVINGLRKHQPGLCALIVTGDTLPQQLSELAASGLPVLHKPFRSEKLRAMVEETMARADRDDSV